MFVGGVVGAGESYDEAALREAEEELGVSGLPRPEYAFTFRYDGEGGRSWWSAVYEVRCVGAVRPQAEEVAWWDFLSEAELERRSGSGSGLRTGWRRTSGSRRIARGGRRRAEQGFVPGLSRGGLPAAGVVPEWSR